MIYFVQGENGGEIKIGTTVRLGDRLPGIKPPDGSRPVILGIADGDRNRESELHAHFSHLRSHGEWFRSDPDLLAFIASEVRSWTPDDDRSHLEPPLRAKSATADGAGPTVLRNLLRLGWAEIKPHASHLSALVAEKTGKPMTRQRISMLMNAVRVEDETIATLAKAIGVKPDELTKD